MLQKSITGVFDYIKNTHLQSLLQFYCLKPSYKVSMKETFCLSVFQLQYSDTSKPINKNSYMSHLGLCQDMSS